MKVKDELLKSAWNVSYGENENWRKFLDKVGKWKCLPYSWENLSYYELFQKHSGVIYVFQEGKYCDFSTMDPFKDALCVHFLGLPLGLAQIYEYRQKPFEEVVILHQLSFLWEHREEFEIIAENGKPITDWYDFSYSGENAVAISKKTLSFEGSFQDGSENRKIHIVMRYISPTSQSSIKKCK